MLVEDARSGCNLLHECRAEELLPRIVAAGVKLEQRNHAGNTPLLEVASQPYLVCHTHGVAAVLDLGANPRVRNEQGRTMLHHVAPYGSVELIDRLMAAGVDQNSRDHVSRETPLMLAVAERSAQRVRLLLERGADATARDESGNTVLHFIARWSHKDECSPHDLTNIKEIVKLLVDAGADPQAQDNDGLNPLQLALLDDGMVAGMGLIASGVWSGAAEGVRVGLVERMMHALMDQTDYLQKRLLEEQKLRERAEAELGEVKGGLRALVLSAAGELRRLKRARHEAAE